MEKKLGLSNIYGEVIENFDIKQVIARAKEETNIEIPKSYCEKYINFFNHRIQEVKEAYSLLDRQEEQSSNLENR